VGRFSENTQPPQQKKATDADENERPHAVRTELPDIERVQQKEHAQANEDESSDRDFAGIDAVTPSAKGRPQSEWIGRRLAQLYSSS
jgi:hypothetical protein